MQYLVNLDKQPWEVAIPYFESRFEMSVRSASAGQLIMALSELGLDASAKTLIVREMDTRIREMDYVHFARGFLPKMTLPEFVAVRRVVLRYAMERASPDDAVLRLAALDALKTALQRGAHRGDGEISVIISGFSEEGAVAQKCAEMVEAVRVNWPLSEIGSRKARFDDKALPALESNAKRLKPDKCAEGSLLDALDHIRYGISPDTDTSYRSHLGDRKALRVPLPAEKLERAAGFGGSRASARV